MAVYPETPVPSLAYMTRERYKTLISEFDTGEEQRRQKWSAPKWDVSLVYNAIRSTDVDKLLAFYDARRGAYEAFSFYDPFTASGYTSVYCGTGNGTSTAFDIPGKQTSGQVVRVNGSTVAFTVSTGTGADGADRILLPSPPAAGAVVTCSFSGKLRIRCRFSEDSFEREYREAGRYRVRVSLTGLEPL